ncbi:prolyl-tRNA synthetase associated domain-containing protein [Candidatus Pacearchaeota archaeon]|nr:prolyl-tRNA synthetase associated domain-containing protein [Candidatus Pacearchaeota archaeon]
MDEKLKKYLEKHNILYKIFEHPAVYTVAESDKVTKNIPGIRSKNLFLRDENNNFYLVSLPGEKRLNTKSLRKHFNLKELNFASPEELKEQLNITPGSVSLFCMIYAKRNIILVIDNEIWSSPIADFHPNINTSTLVVSHKDLEKFVYSLKNKIEVIDCG